MEPCCQVCGAADPRWVLKERSGDVNGWEICDKCAHGGKSPIRLVKTACLLLTGMTIGWLIVGLIHGFM